MCPSVTGGECAYLLLEGNVPICYWSRFSTDWAHNGATYTFFVVCPSGEEGELVCVLYFVRFLPQHCCCLFFSKEIQQNVQSLQSQAYPVKQFQTK